MARLGEIIIKHKELIKRGLVLLGFACCFVGCWKKQTTRPVIIRERIAAPSKNVRVLLHGNTYKCVLSSSGGFTLRDSKTQLKAHFGVETGPLEITAISGYLKIGDRMFGNGTIITPDQMSLIKIDGKAYRGIVKLLTSSDGRSFQVINELHIEEYLAGVVGAEMPSYWGEHALKAQTIAARTYCLYTKNRFGRNRPWDVKRTQANQVYRGVSAETVTVKRAVRETRSMVLQCRHRDSTTGIFPAYYSSTCGGHTESSYNTFGEYFPPLTGVECNYCKKTAPPNYLAWGPVVFSETEVSTKIIAHYPSLAELVTIESIENAKMSNYGKNDNRVLSFRLIGKDGKDAYLKSEDLRLTLDSTGMKMKSTYCKFKKENGKYSFTGKGFGHGVGMCQYGAQAMAREGRDYKQILRFYYPTAVIIKR